MRSELVGEGLNGRLRHCSASTQPKRGPLRNWRRLCGLVHIYFLLERRDRSEMDKPKITNAPDGSGTATMKLLRTKLLPSDLSLIHI